MHTPPSLSLLRWPANCQRPESNSLKLSPRKSSLGCESFYSRRISTTGTAVFVSESTVTILMSGLSTRIPFPVRILQLLRLLSSPPASSPVAPRMAGCSTRSAARLRLLSRPSPSAATPSASTCPKTTPPCPKLVSQALRTLTSRAARPFTGRLYSWQQLFKPVSVT